LSHGSGLFAERADPFDTVTILVEQFSPVREGEGKALNGHRLGKGRLAQAQQQRQRDGQATRA